MPAYTPVVLGLSKAQGFTPVGPSQNTLLVAERSASIRIEYRARPLWHCTSECTAPRWLPKVQSLPASEYETSLRVLILITCSATWAEGYYRGLPPDGSLEISVRVVTV